MTSSAVVGSSAMTTLGCRAIAEAISARWRRPPESSWGRWRSTVRGVGHADLGEQLECSGSAGGRGSDTVQLQRLDDLVADRPQRVEGDERILQHEPDSGARSRRHVLSLGPSRSVP